MPIFSSVSGEARITSESESDGKSKVISHVGAKE
jgi:hypothetical protein